MAATTIDSYSDELTLAIAPLYAPLKTNRMNGKIRNCSFRVTLASQAAGQDIAVAIIPKGARILGGTIVASAALSNSAQVSVGIMGKDGSGNIDDALASGPGLKPDGSAVTTGTVVSDSVTALKAAAVLSTTRVDFALTQALGYGYETAKELYLTLTTSVGTVGTEVITGHISYVVD